MSDKSEIILKTVEEALGYHATYFNIEKGDTLADDDDSYSITVCIHPKTDLPILDDNKIVADKCYLQFDMVDDEISLITGEDGQIELSVTFGNIYSQLYWNEVLKVAE